MTNGEELRVAQVTSESPGLFAIPQAVKVRKFLAFLI